MISHSPQQVEFSQNYLDCLQALSNYDQNLKFVDKVYAYGTSGFRYDENELERIAFRLTVVTALKSQCKNGLPIGIVITGSHNKYTDNGFKIAGIDGESISSEWEVIYTKIINSKNLVQDLKVLIEELIVEDMADTKYFFRDVVPRINVGVDTRRSCQRLSQIVEDCLKILNASHRFYGIVTTPQLHFLTALNQSNFKKKNPPNFYYADEDDYWKFLSNGYLVFNTFYDQYYTQKTSSGKYESKVLIDCANGAAAYNQKNIKKIFGSAIEIQLINTNWENHATLNDNCGAEHLHKIKKLPVNYPEESHFIKNASFDGDVDRIIYFIKKNNEIKIIDGDRLTCLFSQALNHLINQLSPGLKAKFLDELKIGIVCTAYSNGAFMSYIEKELGFNLQIAKTGVKNLHAKAKNLDLSIYFESNGHGTIYCKDNIKQKIDKLTSFIESSTDGQTLELLEIFLSLFNKSVGDSISALISIECSLKMLNLSISDLSEIYNELYSVNLKINVSDKSLFKPNEDETRLIEPQEIQDLIDKTCKDYPSSRCFVRPSGTEDVVRIYAEAKNPADAKTIAELIGLSLINKFNN